MIKEFREFINRGNVVDLAVAVVVGAAFTGVVTAFTDGILKPLLAAVGGNAEFTYSFKLRGTEIPYGLFLTAVLNFLIVAFAMFLVVKAVNKAQNFRRTPEEEAADEVTELQLLTEIRDALVQKGS